MSEQNHETGGKAQCQKWVFGARAGPGMDRGIARISKDASAYGNPRQDVRQYDERPSSRDGMHILGEVKPKQLWDGKQQNRKNDQAKIRKCDELLGLFVGRHFFSNPNPQPGSPATVLQNFVNH
jgi:hypothetical protein